MTCHPTQRADPSVIVASYERDPANPGVSSLSCPKITHHQTPATTTPTRPETPPAPHHTRSTNLLHQPLDIPTSFT